GNRIRPAGTGFRPGWAGSVALAAGFGAVAGQFAALTPRSAGGQADFMHRRGFGLACGDDRWRTREMLRGPARFRWHVATIVRQQRGSPGSMRDRPIRGAVRAAAAILRRVSSPFG